MINETQKLLLLNLLERLLKSWWTVVAGVCVGASLAVVGLHFTNPVYEAAVTIEADVEKLPSEFIRRTISDDVELQLHDLRMAVLSDRNLRTVIVAVFGTPHSGSHEQAVANRIASNVALQFSQRTRTITVRYRDSVPERAARVANMLAEFFVVENKGLRAASAQQVRESMESLAMEASTELEAKKQELNELLMKHPQELESQRANHEQAIVRLQEDLEENEKAIRAAKRRVSTLESQHTRQRVEETGDQRVVDAGREVGGKDPRIIEIEQEIEELLTRLTENHPEVIAKRRELERRREAVESEGDTDEVSQVPAEQTESVVQLPTLDIWDTRLQASKLTVERLENENRGIRREIGRYRGYLTNMPMIQRQVDDLNARVSVLQETYLGQQRKIEAARAGQQLEEEDIANPFMVTRRAAPPGVPVWPDRMMFLVAGVAMGLLVFAGPVLAYGFLKPTILTEASLSLLADVPVLVAIPIIPTPAVARRRRQTNLRNLGLAALAVAVLMTVAAVKFMDLI